MGWLYKMERKLGRFAISNLMLYIVIAQFVVYLLDIVGFAQMMNLGTSISGLLSLSRAMVLRGQVWRLVTFVMVPSFGSPIWLLIGLMFYYFIGSQLEQSWGSFKFNVYYFVGMLGIIVASFITGGATNEFLNLSMFFAFAILYPEEPLRIFFIVSIKAKWLALVSALMYVYTIVISLLTGNWANFAAIVASLINLILFFWRDAYLGYKNWARYRKTRNNYRAQQREWARNQQNQRNNQNWN
jgi:membrane associated rhomboid family serine protease